jgi:hypothetical protein
MIRRPPRPGKVGKREKPGMSSRKWLVRSLFLGFLAALGGGALLVYSYMRPEFVREQLIHQLGERFTDVEVEVHSARLRLLGGGIAVTDLRLTRRDDPTHTPFLHVPSAVLHHDKEQLNAGRLVVRKVEMMQPKLRLERDAAGRWNVEGILRPQADGEPSPIFVLREAHIVVTDRRIGEQPLAEWKGVNATIVNDPAPVITFEARGSGMPTGPFRISGRFDRRGGVGGSLDLPDVPLGADLARVAEAVLPDAADYLKPLTGRASVHLDGVWQGGTSAPVFYHDLRVRIRDGRYEHPNLPFPLEKIELSFRSKNGDLTLESCSARSGQASFTASLDLPREPPCAPGTVALHVPPSVGGVAPPERGPVQEIEDRLRRLDVTVTNLVVTPELCAKLPGRLQSARDMLKPEGPLDVTYAFRRGEGGWTKTLTIRPDGMATTYRGFPYRVRNVRGVVTHKAAAGATERVRLDLKGEGAGANVTLTGTITGSYPDADVDLTITGVGVTLDDELVAAMPDDNPDLLRKLHATAMGDFTARLRHNARIRREYGPDVFDNQFTITVRNGSMKYEAFPYPLEELKGTLLVRTVPERPGLLPKAPGGPAAPAEEADSTGLEFKNFTAVHHGARLRGSGRKDAAPGGMFLTLAIDAEDLPLDGDLRQALAAIRMENSWQTLEPSGRINCGIRVRLFSRSDPAAELYAPEDLELGLAFAGGAVRPAFFPYRLHDLAGQLTYAKGRVEIKELRARHGPSQLALPKGEILFRPGGGYWADVRDLRVNPLLIDEEFLKALAPGLRSAIEALELKGPMALHAARMVVDEKPGPYLPRQLPGTARGAAPAEGQPVTAVNPARAVLPTVFWDGSLTFAGASLKTGVPWENVHGTFASWGLYKGDHLGAVRGNLLFEKATVAKQPAEAVSVQLRVDPRQPDVLQVPAIRGKFYGGDVGGEAWVLFDGPEPRYALRLDATRIKLEDVAKHYKLPPKARLEGLATAQVYLSNRPDERTGKAVLQGGGSIDVPDGKLLNLPVLLNLIKVVRLRAPDETGFEEAHALFTVRGDRIRFGQLDLIGNAVCLAGEGEMTTDGTGVSFEFYPVWSKVKEMFALPGEWSGAISRKFLKIRVSGTLDKLDYKAEPVPGLVDPVKRVFGRLK